MDGDFTFDAPCYTDLGAYEPDDNADEWFEGRRTSQRRPAAASAKKTPARSRAATAAAASAVKQAEESKEQPRNLRKRAREAVVMPVRSEAPLTIPQTPRVLKKAKVKHEGEQTKFVSVAESVAQFSSRTPPRFHVAPAKAKFRPTRNQARRGITRAQSPKFQPRRLRPRAVQSTAEREEQLMKEIKPFKSQPVPKEVLESKGDLGVPRVASKEPTVPLEFNFATQRRAELRPKTAPAEEEDHVVHANPFPEKLFTARPKSASKSARPLTIPHSPKLTRPAARPEPKEEEPLVVDFHAQPMPVVEHVFQPVLPHAHTEPQPFAVADKNPMVTRQRLAQQAAEELARMRDFKAHGIPSYSPHLPAVAAKPATVPQPFALPGEHIRKHKIEMFQEQVQKDMEMSKEQREFHAQPCRSTVVPPFDPKRSDKALTEINSFEFKLDKRAAERAMFDEHLREKERQEEMEKEQKDKERQELEKQEVAAMRKAREIKANPIRRFKDVAPPKTFPLTEPQSPAFSKRIRT